LQFLQHVQTVQLNYQDCPDVKTKKKRKIDEIFVRVDEKEENEKTNTKRARNLKRKERHQPEKRKKKYGPEKQKEKYDSEKQKEKYNLGSEKKV